MSVGKAWALCDLREGKTGQPVTAQEIRRVLGIDRTQLRQWERQGRLDVYYTADAKGTRQKAYMRPREREYIGSEEV